MRYIKKFNESVAKFSDDFISNVEDICLELTDDDCEIVSFFRGYYLLGKTEQAYNRLTDSSKATGTNVTTESFRICVNSKHCQWNKFNITILESTLTRLEELSSNFDFLVDVYIDYMDRYYEVVDIIDLYQDKKKWDRLERMLGTEITIIIY